MGSVFGGGVLDLFGQNFTVTGTNVAPIVYFGTVASPFVSCTNAPTHCQAGIPAAVSSLGGPVSIAVVNTNGLSSTLVDAFTYLPQPVITSVTPNRFLDGTYVVAITGTGFYPSSSNPAQANLWTSAFGFGYSIPGNPTNIVSTFPNTGVNCSSTTTCTVTIGPGILGTVDLRAEDALGSPAWSPAGAADQVAFFAAPWMGAIQPAAGWAAGWQTVTISGQNFATGSGATTFNFITGTTSRPATGVNWTSSTTCTAVTPAGTVGTTAVVQPGLSGVVGTGSTFASFTYVPAPVVTSISPSSGLTLGGAVVTITGTDLFSTAVGVPTIKFGTTAATNVSCSSSTTCTATSPAGTGTVDVTVTTTSGTSAISAADRFTYTTAGGGTSSPLGVLTSPVPGSTLAGSTVTFSWTAGTQATQYWLFVGSTPGGLNLYNQNQGSALSATVSGLPTNGSTVYVRLWSLANGTWQFHDYTFTAA